MAKGMIYKYRLSFDKLTAIQSCVEIIHIAMQHNQPTVWALVDTTSKSVASESFPVVLRVYATGELALGDHVGTFYDGPYVWHVFQTRVIESAVKELEASGVLRFERVPELGEE